MALPKIDAPVYEIDLPLSKKHIRFRPFLVKEQRNLMMAMESDDKETIEKNIRQVLHNCTLTPNVDIDSLPIIDVEFYFINLRARSVGEVIETKYRCENEVNDKPCGNLMDTSVNLLDIKVEFKEDAKDIVQLTDTIAIKLKYPEFSMLERATKFSSATDMAFQMIVESIEYIFDGEEIFYSKDASQEELTEFIETLQQKDLDKIKEFFDTSPKIKKQLDFKCKKCGHEEEIHVEGINSFFV